LLFALLCLGELVFGRINSAIQLRVTPRQRQYVARALFRHLHGHSHRFLTENFAGALANRVGETSHGVNQVMWAVVTEFWPIVFSSGTIVEDGSHAALLARRGPYYRLWSRQSGGLLPEATDAPHAINGQPVESDESAVAE
jgi:ATP-binding cassette subfamily B protein